jgi:hypothetical protein
MNKQVLIGLGVLAVAGIAVYLYKKDKKEDATEKKTDDKKTDEKKSGYFGAGDSSYPLGTRLTGVRSRS